MITIDDFKKIEIRAGKIVSAEKIEESEKLLRLSVNFGSVSAEGYGGTKQVISGIAKYISPENLLGITCAFVTNLEPRNIMGFESQAMIMAVSGENFFSLLKLDDNIPPGSIVK